jgi:hypothetical protein
MKISREWGRRGLVWAVLTVHVGLLAWGAVVESPTYDEPAHLAAGIRFWQTGHSDLDRGNPPLFRAVAALPVLCARPAVDWHSVPDTSQCDLDFLAANGPRSFRLITLGRWACISFSVLGAVICYRWAQQWYGNAAGMTALLLWCFSPNILAHGYLITGDMSATSLGVAAFYMFWRWLSAPGWSRAAWAGVFLGLVELSKFVWLALFVLWPVGWLAWRWLHRHDPGRPSWLREATQFAAIGLLSLWVINLGYGFEDSLHRFRRGAATDPSFQQPVRGGYIAQTGLAAWVRVAPVPLPKNYVLGIAEVQGRSDSVPRSYLRGEQRIGGWWYYYLYAFLVKEPLGTLLLMVLATVLALLAADYRTDWRREVFLLVPLLLLLGVVSMAGVSQRLRYALPLFPFLFVWASRTGRAWVNRDRAIGVAAAGCVAWSAMASLAIYPHSLSYFNALAGGPMHAYQHLNDANIDWGQDLFRLKTWCDDHPEARPFHLAYFGTVDPRLAGIEYSLPPADGPQPGWHAMSVQLFTVPGRKVWDGQGGTGRAGTDMYRYFLDLQPVATAGYSIYIYHLTFEEANELRAKRGLPLLRQGKAEEKQRSADGVFPALIRGIWNGVQATTKTK